LIKEKNSASACAEALPAGAAVVVVAGLVVVVVACLVVVVVVGAAVVVVGAAVVVVGAAVVVVVGAAVVVVATVVAVATAATDECEVVVIGRLVEVVVEGLTSTDRTSGGREGGWLKPTTKSTVITHPAIVATAAKVLCIPDLPSTEGYRRPWRSPLGGYRAGGPVGG
jgi:hypothetical protein